MIRRAAIITHLPQKGFQAGTAHSFGPGHVPDDVQALCEMVTIAGKKLEETSKVPAKVEGYFKAMEKLGANTLLAPRIRFLVRDVLDLRRMKWVPRRETLKVPPPPASRPTPSPSSPSVFYSRGCGPAPPPVTPLLPPPAPARPAMLRLPTIVSSQMVLQHLNGTKTLYHLSDATYSLHMF